MPHSLDPSSQLAMPRQSHNTISYDDPSIPTLSQLYDTSSSLILSPFQLERCSNSLHRASKSINDRISLWQGDLTTLEIDAIVNATNTNFNPGGGVDGAIHRAAGPNLRSELKTHNQSCPTGHCVLTFGWDLPARHVIHTVGPIYTTNRNRAARIDEDVARSQLASCYRTALRLAVQSGIKTLAFPCVSTGVYGYPSEEAAEVVCATVRKYMEETGAAEQIERIIFCIFEDRDAAAYQSIISKYFPPVE